MGGSRHHTLRRQHLASGANRRIPPHRQAIPGIACKPTHPSPSARRYQASRANRRIRHHPPANFVGAAIEAQWRDRGPVHRGVGVGISAGRETVAHCKPSHPSPSAREFRLVLNGLATVEQRRLFCSNEGACVPGVNEERQPWARVLVTWPSTAPVIGGRQRSGG
jgi:hypothetical protein